MSKKIFNLGVIFGAVLGGAIAYFYSPKSGKENRKMAKKAYESFMKSVDQNGFDETVKDIFGQASAEGKKLYAVAQKELDMKLKKAYESLSEMDFSQYETMVKDTISKVESEAGATQERVAQIKKYLLNKWEHMNS